MKIMIILLIQEDRNLRKEIARLKFEYYYPLIEGYKKHGLSPTEIFLLKTNPEYLFNLDLVSSKNREQTIENFRNRYPLQERLRLGLPISNEEYKLNVLRKEKGPIILTR